MCAFWEFFVVYFSAFPMKHNGSFIGFTAWKQSEQAFVENDPIIFDGTSINEGGYYQPALGRFTCPFDGIYFVAVTYKGVTFVDDYDDTYLAYLDVQLEQDSEPFLHLFANNDGNPRNTVTNTGITRCSQGEHISVYASSEGRIYGEQGIPLSTFTVMLMHQGSSSGNYVLHRW